jgi:hypothetical protein
MLLLENEFAEFGLWWKEYYFSDDVYLMKLTHC